MFSSEVFKTPPQHVNEKGVKFWLDKDLTKYAHDKGVPTAQVLLVEEPNGKRTRILTNHGKPIADEMSIEGISAQIDKLVIIANFDAPQPADDRTFTVETNMPASLKRKLKRK